MKEFFIQHTEKLVLGLSALIAVYFLYSALTVQQYDKTPQDFQEVISRASQTVRKSEPQLDDLPPLNFEQDLAKLKKPVDGTSYQLKTPFLRALELGFQFRGTPRILSPDRPEAMVNRGLVLLQEKEGNLKGNEKVFSKLLREGYPAELIWFLGNEGLVYELGILPKAKGAAPAGNNAELDAAARAAVNRDAKGPDAKPEKRKTARGVTWVEIVSSFPHANQIREYISTLKESAEVAGVRYALAEVQRQELTESMEWTPWARIGWEKQFDLFNSADKLDNPLQDIPSGVVPGLVMHAPERATIGAAGGGVGAIGGAVIQTRRSLIPDPFLNANPTPPKWTPAELDPRAAEDELKPMRPQNIVKNEDGEEVDIGVPNPARVAAAVGGGLARTTFNNDSQYENVMVRAFDFTAESGKRYRYRVRAVLFNPNFNRPDVLDPDDAMKPFLVGEWSEPSEEVYVEPTTEMMLAENKTNQADRAQFSVYHWLAREGRWVGVDAAWFVGQIVGTGAIKPIEVPHYDPKDGKVTIVKQPIEGFDTGIAVLDVSPSQIRDNVGGLDFTIQPPKEVVVVNQYGDLIHRKELNDLADVKRVERDTSIREAVANPEGGGVRNNAREKPARPAKPDKDDGGDLENPAADSN